MSRSEPEATRIVRSWLEEGVTALPDHVLDAVLDQLPATHQRRPSWLARRSPTMNKFVGFGLAAAAVVVLAVIGIQLMGGSNPGGPAPEPSPSLAPSAAPTPAAPSGALTPGTTYRVSGDILSFTFSVPTAGWSAEFEDLTYIGHEGSPEETILWLGTGPKRTPAVFPDPCIHESVDDLLTFDETAEGYAEAFGSLARTEVVSEPDFVSVDGYGGQTMTTAFPTDLGCENSEYWLIYDSDCPQSVPTGGCTTYPSWAGEEMTSWWIDVPAALLTVTAEVRYPDEASPGLTDEIQEIVDSIRFENPG